MYNYFEEVKKDIRAWLEDNALDMPYNEYGEAEIDRLYDELWTEDSVTGNGSEDMYYQTDEEAAAALYGNNQAFMYAAQDFGLENYNDFCANPRKADVLIRCNYLGAALDEVIAEKIAEEKGR